MGERPPLTGILETVVYCDASNEEAVKRFYEEVLGLARKTANAFRISEDQVLLVFNADESCVQDDPPPHGARGPVHCCFLASAASYEEWKRSVEGAGVAVYREITWPSGARSFYFDDPAGNVLEIADGDLWPA